ncbi:MAG: SBBP repeat-containing protein [Candidatus Hydrogenedentes bacterium]|nr:SBBP repeat-containing protein [Candidatus Hydrogenedentota bacterium]
MTKPTRAVFLCAVLLTPGLFASFPAAADDGDLAWARQLGGSDDTEGRSIALDRARNAISAGVFLGTSDFDPGAGTQNLTATGDTDGYISKLDKTGAFVWVKQLDGAVFDIRVAVDRDDNVYAAGGFTSATDFDPSAGEVELTPVGLTDVFICKYASDGALVWAKQFGGTVEDTLRGLAVDDEGNAYTTGDFGGTADFDPGAGTFSFTALGNIEAFVSKLDTNGNLVWARQFETTDIVQGYGIAVDANQNVYTTGSFSESTDFDPGISDFVLTSVVGTDAFVAKLNASGNFVWARRFGGDLEEIGLAIDVDAGGRAVVAGKFDDDVHFPTTTTELVLSTVDEEDAFVVKLNKGGNALWARRLGGLESQIPLAIAIDPEKNVFVAGGYDATMDADPGAGVQNLGNVGGGDAFVVKLNGAGSFVWGTAIQGTDDETCFDVVADSSGNAHVTGRFTGSTDFAAGLEEFILQTGTDIVDAFVVKFSGVPRLAVLSPNGGESWRIGETHEIAWDPAGVIAGNMTIKLLRDGDVVKTLAESIADDGSFTWKIKDKRGRITPGDDYTIKIVDANPSNPTNRDESDAPFEILPRQK